MKGCARQPSSFRDPDGFVFHREGAIYRQINAGYREYYDHLMNSGLYRELVNKKLLISHHEVETERKEDDKVYRVIKPERIPFVSYPYEWCFSQLKEAALVTLEIQKIALKHGMSLKDCSAYNIQFSKGRPIFIDTLSFEKYREGQPWVAYRQFCRHFLAPLALMRYRDVSLNRLLRINIDGIPLNLASSLLPYNTRFMPSLGLHIHLHAGSQKHFAGRNVNLKKFKINKLSLSGLIDSLESGVKKLKWNACGTEWGEYYKDTNYTSLGFNHKKEIVTRFLAEIGPKNVWDLGGNTGAFSRIAGNSGIHTLSFDKDPACVEKNYLMCRKQEEVNILPLFIDLANPSPGIGWQNKERSSLMERGPADMAFALALIHHLAISNNTPFAKVAEFMRNICNSLIIEFIPKSDSQVQRLLSAREDIFPGYTMENFEIDFIKHFTIKEAVKIKGSERFMYLMTGK